MVFSKKSAKTVANRQKPEIPSKSAQKTAPKTANSAKIAENQQKTEKPSQSTKKSKSKPVKTRLSPADKFKITLICLLALGLCAYVIWDVATGGPLMWLFENRDRLIALVERGGPLGPLVFLILQVAQTVFAPIPGNITGGIGGFLFGWWGVLWTFIGTAIGLWIIFLLAKKFGRPLVERIVKAENLEKFDFVAKRNVAVILFLIFLLPGLPDDIVAYIGGLSNLSVKQLLILALIGRFPTLVVTNYLGMGLTEANVVPVFLIAFLVILGLALVLWQRERIWRWLRGLGRDKKEP